MTTENDTFKCVAKSVRITPRKARLVINLIRGKHVQEALDALYLTDKKACLVIQKVLKSAISNATHQASVDVDNLFINRAFVDPGHTLKRFIPRAQGRASAIKKRTCHITIELGEI